MAIPPQYLEPAQIAGIVYWGRSGTILLHSLLDSHPDVLSCNAYFWMYSFKMDEFLAAEPEPTPEKLLSFICDAYPYLFEHWPTFFPEMFRGANCDLRFGTNRERFIAAFKEYLACFPVGTPFQNLPNGHTVHSFVLQAICVAYAIAQGQPLESPRPTIVWQTHFWQADYFRSRFPQIRILSAIRHPLKGYDSWQLRTFEDERVPPFWFYHAVKFRQMIEFMKVPTDLVERCRAIRFEDIHNRTEAVTRALAEWLGIRWHPCLLESTFDGEPYWGVKGGYAHAFKPGEIPSKTALVTGTKKYDESKMDFKYLGLLDRLRITAFCESAFKNWSYEPVPADKRFQRLLTRYRYLLLMIPSSLDRRCYREDLKLELQKQPQATWWARCKLIAASWVQLFRNLKSFRQEMSEVERAQADWPAIPPLFTPQTAVEPASKQVSSSLHRAA